jgi:uncharacterized protein with PIN domain
MSRDNTEPSFIADRMLGTLTRYLRFLGYDTISANSLRLGNLREDTLLLEIAQRDGRILLTKDRELARRGGDRAVLVTPEDVLAQLAQLIGLGILKNTLRLKMLRCSLCNTRLRPATGAEVSGADYAPSRREGMDFFWCPRCRRLYWMGSHAQNLTVRLEQLPGTTGGNEKRE